MTASSVLIIQSILCRSSQTCSHLQKVEGLQIVSKACVGKFFLTMPKTDNPALKENLIGI